MQIIAQVIILSLPIPIVQVDFFKFYRYFEWLKHTFIPLQKVVR